MSQHRSVVRDGMHIEWDVPIEVDDGLVLRADVYRPVDDGEHPVLVSYGPYGKLLHFEDGYPDQWDRMVEQHPDVPAGSTNKYQSWEVVDPEQWVPDGYAVVRVDSRGAGRSPGSLDPWSPRETADFAQCIEWAGEQPWSNGMVGANGISYYAANQWQVAAERPAHLAAICAWEGLSDFYREQTHHGGIYCPFNEDWYEMQVKTVQHGLGEAGFRSRMTGGWVAGPETLTDEELGANRTDLGADYRNNPLATDDYWRERNADFSRIEVPLLSAANWGGQGLHPRGNIEGYLRSAAEQKWLEVHGLEHWTEFYTDYGVDLQKRFFDYFLRGEDTGWSEQPPVQLQVRHADGHFEERHEEAWPIPRTEWTACHLDAADHSMAPRQTEAAETAESSAATSDASVTYDALGDGVTFLTPPLAERTEVTGPLAATLFVESDTEDADLFLVFRVFTPDLEEVVFQGALDPHTPVAQGWLRASHRKLDDALSEPWRPYHPHDEVQPLDPGNIYELAVELWPTSVVVPAGYHLGLSVRGRDYEYPGDVEGGLASMTEPFTGVGPFVHDDPRDRPPAVYGGEVTIHTGPDHPSHVLLPVVPERA